MNAKGIIALMLAGALAAGALTGCGSNDAASDQQATDQAATTEQATTDTAATTEEEPTPITGSQIADGSYDITVDTDSSMVNVVYCKLEVASGQMTATMALHGEGFTKIFFGSAEEAANADKSQVYEYTKDDDGLYTLTFPVEALDTPTDVALYGVRRDTWYDHELTFESDGIPADAITK